MCIIGTPNPTYVSQRFGDERPFFKYVRKNTEGEKTLETMMIKGREVAGSLSGKQTSLKMAISYLFHRHDGFTFH